MSLAELNSLSNAVAARMPFAQCLFDAVRAVSEDFVGVTRPAWSEQDQAAAQILAEAAYELDLEVSYDPAGNLVCTLPGADRKAARILTGSHLDSVPTGGHFDGLAGVVAGLSVLAAVRDLGIELPCDLSVMGIRGEESVWFGIAYVGSRLALGTLPLADLGRLRRSDSGRSLAEHMAAVGLDVDRLLTAPAPSISRDNTRAFFELHIEQGPILVGEGVAVGIPTTIRGNVRFPFAACNGSYAHSAAVPRAYREDALLAVVELVRDLEQNWIEQESAAEPDSVFTVGKLYTDAKQHAMTKVPGRCEFTLNFGGTSAAYLASCREQTFARAQAIAAARRVSFELGECVGSDPTPLDEGLRALLTERAESLGIAYRRFATVGHDASIFARAGIPAAMVLVRNADGSHNPDEKMDLKDFARGVQVLAAAMVSVAADE
jgi:N-carbamoyl-L-amino-acid hydrolase